MTFLMPKKRKVERYTNLCMNGYNYNKAWHWPKVKGSLLKEKKIVSTELVAIGELYPKMKRLGGLIVSQKVYIYCDKTVLWYGTIVLFYRTILRNVHYLVDI